MRKYRVGTTISKKHHELLLKHVETFGTQQKVLEHALESLANEKDHVTELTREEELWHRMYSIKDMFTLITSEYAKILFDTVNMEQLKEYIEEEKPMEFLIEWYYNKPLHELNLHELIDGIILTVKIHTPLVVATYGEHREYYSIDLKNNISSIYSNTLLIMYESVFRSYGIESKSQYRGRSTYFEIQKQ